MESFVKTARKICSIFALFTPLWGQATAPSKPADQVVDSPTVFRIETRLVVLHATATGRDGKLVLDLPQRAFHVYENGVEQNLNAFRNEDVPISLGLIIDSSASMQDKRDRVNAAALALLEASNREDEVFLINFSENPSLDVDYTGDLATMKKGLARIHSNGGTAMRDAIRAGIEHLKDRKKDKKVLLVVTDGNDNASVESLERLMRIAQREEVLIYAIGLLGDESPRAAEKARRDLDVLAQATGGQTYYPADVAEIARIAPRIAQELRNQYTLGYTPANPEADGLFRQIRVVVDAPGVQIRTRSGYYAAAPAN